MKNSISRRGFGLHVYYMVTNNKNLELKGHNILFFLQGNF